MSMNRVQSQDQRKLINPDMRKSTSLELIGKPLSHMEYIASLLKCPICAGQVKQAHMCPSCCKLFCELCIKNSIVYKKAQCPCCAKPLRYTSTVNCDALARQIQQAINKTVNQISEQLQQPHSPYSKILSGAFSTPDLNTQQSRITITSNSNYSLCPEHELRLQYYCETCAVGVCSDCAVLSNKHQGHKLCKFSHKRLKFQEKINALLKSIASMKSDVMKKRDDKSQKFDNVRRSQRQKKQTLAIYLKKCSDATQAKLSSQIQKKTQTSQKQRERLQDLTSLYKKYEDEIYSYKKVSIVRKSNELINELKQITLTQSSTTNFYKQSLESQFTPSFASKTFILDNYSHLRQKADILYSQPLFYKGIQWKLRIFPAGIQQAREAGQNQRFLAIYLEMSKGHRQPNIYKYEIILINQADRSKAIGCTFENQFQEGTYWGLDKFANISFLYSQRFIHPVHDYLEIVLNVKPPTYHHAVRDQNYFISQKQAVYAENLAKLKQLRKKVGKGLLNFKSGTRSLLVRALVDKDEPKMNMGKRSKSNVKF